MVHPILMIPGPTNLSDDVLKALCQPMIGHTSQEFYEEFKEAHLLTSKLFGSDPERTVLFSGSGTFGMEALFSSFAKPGDKVLSIVNGYFGDRFAEIGSIYGLNVKTLKFEPPEDVDFELLENELSSESYDFVTLTHIDTSTGIMNDIRGVGKVVKEHGAFFVVDMVSSLGCTEFNFETEPVDYAFSASQKCVGAPPGAVMVAFSKELLEKRGSVKGRSYYFDLKRWLPIMRDPSIYLSTPNIAVIRAFRVALNEVFEEGLQNKIRRHKELGEIAYDFVVKRGWKPLSKRPSPSVIAFDLGKPVANEVAKSVYKQGILVAKGLGALSSRVIRVGYMGSTTKELLYNTLKKIEDAFNEINQ